MDKYCLGSKKLLSKSVKEAMHPWERHYSMHSEWTSLLCFVLLYELRGLDGKHAFHLENEDIFLVLTSSEVCLRVKAQLND